MAALHVLPLYVQAILVFIIATYLLYVFKFKAKTPMPGVPKQVKISLYAFVLWFYGIGFMILLDYGNIGDEIKRAVLIAVNAIPAALFVLGLVFMYAKGSDEVRKACNTMLREMLKILLIGIVLILFVGLLGKLGIIS